MTSKSKSESKSKLNAQITLFSHADTDCLVIASAKRMLPPEFAVVNAVNLQQIRSEEQMQMLLAADQATADIIIVRLLGKIGTVPGFSDLLKHVKQRQTHFAVVSGTGELNPELAAISNVPADLLVDVTAYLQAGGVENVANLLKYLSDRLLFTGFGYAPPTVVPEHGIYHPALSYNASLEDWLELHDPAKPVAGINFYRAHWLSGNTAFVDRLIDALALRNIDSLPVFTSSLKMCNAQGGLPAAYEFFIDGTESRIDTLINTTSFAATEGDTAKRVDSISPVNYLCRLNVPVIQAVTSGMSEESWRSSQRGLNPLDTAMNVVLPEFDGRIISVPISFKQPAHELKSYSATYQAQPERINRVAGLVEKLINLKRLPNREKRIAFILTNSNAKASQIGNAVGLDAPASLLRIMQAMTDLGYNFKGLPDSGTKLIHDLIARCSYDESLLTEEQCREAIARIPSYQYAKWFQELPEEQRLKMEGQWGTAPGNAYVSEDHLIVAGLNFGNAIVVLQPPRGYGMDPNAIYHMPDLPPTHHYVAFYQWLRKIWQADAIVHVGKHGTLEWLPGKGVGLSANCFPDSLLADMPLFYPFILNDPGEGAQAKRRAHAIVVDHLTPPMTSADTYGPLAKLTQLVDEYYQVEVLDPAKLPVLQQQIWDLIKETNLHTDLKYILAHDHDQLDDDHDRDHDHDHDLPREHHHQHKDNDNHDDDDDDHDDDDHDHDHWDDTLTDKGVPVTLAKMGGFDVAHLIQEIDGYLCELGAAEIRDGLHTLGQAPQGDQLIDMLCSMTRLANLHVPSLPAAISKYFGLDLPILLANKGTRFSKRPRELERAASKPIVTHSDALAALDIVSHALFKRLESKNYDELKIDDTINEVLGDQVLGTMANTIDTLHANDSCIDTRKEAVACVLRFASSTLVPNLERTDEEIDNLIKGLAGGYIPAGPSGAPSRGMAHILPTGRNFYSVDPRSLPSHTAWQVGKQLCAEALRRHLRETGRYPESVSISVWGTSAMRTHGDDIAQIMALMGVRPVWQDGTRRISGVELIPLAELARPRIDVTTRISGFFRDAFPHLIELLDQAVNLVIAADEPPEMNFLKKHYLAEMTNLLGLGAAFENADRQCRYRIFGSMPGSYGAGILPLIQEKNWSNTDDFAEAYVNWGGFAYTSQEHGVGAKHEFKERLKTVEVALHNQDNREHDIFDSDDYLQFHGGMIATIASLSGRRPKRYFGDSHDPASPAVRDLKEEVLRVFRSRVINPKWLTSIQRHGYKGGLELAATIDYLFGYDATADILEDWMYEAMADQYALNPAMQDFLQESNPWALNTISERLLEAAKRKMWVSPKTETIDNLHQTLLRGETLLEARGEKKRQPQEIVEGVV